MRINQIQLTVFLFKPFRSQAPFWEGCHISQLTVFIFKGPLDFRSAEVLGRLEHHRIGVASPWPLSPLPFGSQPWCSGLSRMGTIAGLGRCLSRLASAKSIITKELSGLVETPYPILPQLSSTSRYINSQLLQSIRQATE